MVTAVLLLLVGISGAQESPWGELIDPDLPDDAKAPSPSTSPIPPPPVAYEPDEAELEPPELRTAAAPAPSKSATDGMVLAGHRVGAVGGRNSATLSEGVVVGGDGGTWMTTVGARVVIDEFSVMVRLPFASYRTPTGRTTGLGNLAAEGWMQLDASDDFEHAVGVIVSVNPGGSTYTWVNDAAELWPGGGVEGGWQMRTTRFGDTSMLARATFGFHGAQGFAPFPKFYPRAVAAGGVDHALTDEIGVFSEVSLAYWDISPMDIAAFVRADPIEGMRIRGGFVLPAFAWLGWTPMDQPSGFREGTFRLDLQTAW